METGAKPSRLGIFVFYDKDGIVDDYIPYLLCDLKENLTDLVIVVNGELTAQGREVFEGLCDKIVIRENAGFDFGAWKYAITDFLGWDKVCAYDELVLVNNSFFGPLYPVKTVFDAMAARAVDFWGLTAQGDRSGQDSAFWPDGIIRHHLQSYMLVFCSSIIRSEAFKRFWNTLPQICTHFDAILYGEAKLTCYLESCGFKWEACVDCGDLDASVDKSDPGSYCMLTPSLLIKKGLPIIKAKCFAFEKYWLLHFHNNEEVRDCLSFIRAHTDYDERMIWQHILRMYNIADIHNAACLNYVLPNRLSGTAAAAPRPKTLVVAQFNRDGLSDEEIRCFGAIPEFADVLAAAASDEGKDIIEKKIRPLLKDRLRVLSMPQNREYETAALFELARPLMREYEYVCFCNGIKPTDCGLPTGLSFARHGVENMLCGEAYVNNILLTFADEPCLGLLVPPPYDGGIYRSVRDGSLYWDKSYDTTVQLAQALRLSVPISPNKMVITTGACFWARTKALRPLLDYSPSCGDEINNQALERIFAFVAQHMGYYTGWVMTPKTAAIMVNNAYPDKRLAPAEPIGVRDALKNYINRHKPAKLRR